MRFQKSDLLTLLVSLFIFTGCENPSSIGLDVDPDIELNSKLVDTSTVVTKLLKQDTIAVSYTDQSVLGYLKDPVFGETTASIAMALTMPSTNYKFGTNPIIDSAVLVIPYLNFYGDSLNSTFTAEVRELNEVLYNESQKVYFSNKTWDKKATILGSATLKTSYKDSITLQDIRTGLSDTVKKVPAQLRVKLDANFIKSKIVEADSLKKVSNLTFNNYFNGLYLSVNKSATTGNGGLFGLNTSSSGAARLEIFYRNTNTSGGLDTLTSTFNITAANAATELKWETNGTAVETALASNTTNNDLLYLKGLGGTYIKVNFPYLQKLKALGSNVTINRAELVFYIDDNNDYAPLDRLRIYRWDIAHRPQYVPDENPSDARYMGPNFVGGFYSKANKAYTVNLTGYIQDLMRGQLKDYGTFISAEDFTSSTGSLNNLGRSILGGGSNTNYKVKLRVFYTDQK
ncbi:DUF4270 domain-containing protein [Pelobium manganitolerans]|uniref:DUF4270 domain-containing protein n=1 Tax=Pelobium manganitolerans TaxID=1842495 RepID=UPI003FA3AEF2